jgi:hypothetical protein
MISSVAPAFLSASTIAGSKVDTVIGRFQTFPRGALVVNPQASVAMIIPAFTYLAAWYVLAGAVYYFLGIETNQRSIEEIDHSLRQQRGLDDRTWPPTSKEA